MNRWAGSAAGSSRGVLGGVLLALALLLAACGGEDMGAQPAPDATATPGAEPGGDGAATDATSPSPESTATEGAEPADGSTALEGQTIDFVVPYEPGGGYDAYVRMVAPVLGDCLGAQVVPVNEPGAGSLLATNQTFVAPPDGTRIQIINAPGAIGAQIADAEGVQYDLREMSWLSRLSAQPNVLSVGADSEFQDFQDLIDADRPVRFVSTGPGSLEHIAAVVLAEVYDFEVEVITGFSGSGEARAAIITGDADAHVQTLDSALGAIEAGDIRPLVLNSREGHEAVPDVPTVYDYPPDNPGQQDNLDVMVDLMDSGRPIAGPPDLPPDVLEALRDGFECALEDEELLAQSESTERPLDPLSGEEMAELIDNVLNSPEEFQQLVRESF